MFTGLVETKAMIASLTDQAGGKKLCVNAGKWKPRSGVFAQGDSICVSGVCLTLTKWRDGELCFDVIHETLAKTKLGKLQPGDAVNLESSLTASTPMGGHFVQGHVDGIGQITQIVTGQESRMTLKLPQELFVYIVPKGSICIDGVSLTIASVNSEQASFEVALIPTTLEVTTFGDFKQGDWVNLETDVISKTIVHWLENQHQKKHAAASTLTLEKLKQAGFVQ